MRVTQRGIHLEILLGEGGKQVSDGAIAPLSPALAPGTVHGGALSLSTVLPGKLDPLRFARGGKSTKIFYSSKSTITLLKFYLSTSKSTSLKIYSSKSKK